MSNELTPVSVDAAFPYRNRSWGHTLTMVLVAVIPFLLTVLAIVWLWQRHVTWLDVSLMLGMWAIAAMGVTLGFHRMLAHGAFEARAPVRFVLLALATMSFQGGPATWAATHRRHHARADMPGDPHSPLEGLWHAHFGWLPKGRLVTRGVVHDRLMRDPVVAFIERTQLFWMIFGLVLPGIVAFAVVGTLTAGLYGMLWGGAVRVFIAHHSTWSVNSIGHAWGTRPYKAPDEARNNLLIALISFGEGWHNNHHAFPQSAWIGHRWYQIDLGKQVIRVLKWLRLVTRVHVPAREERQARLRRRASMRAGQ
jgi:stearoyl-CoA desaturase (Delta-9 desaturase)